MPTWSWLSRHILRDCCTNIASLPLRVAKPCTKGSAVTVWSTFQNHHQPTRHFTRIPKMALPTEGWHIFDNYSVYAWSLSGIETCVVVKSEDLKVVFDMGNSIPQSVSSPHVFISHGHIDHIGGVTNHANTRGLFGMSKARYFVPPHLVNNLKAITSASNEMAQTSDQLKDVCILPCSPEDTIALPNNYYVRAFPTVHRIPSQGYILYRQTKQLKSQYVGQPSATIAELHRNNVPIHDVIVTPEVAFTGDTMIEVFLRAPTPDLLRCKVLIVEATFIDHSDKADNVKKAREYGHIHLQELIDNAHLFRDVKHILLIHFSSKYSPEYIQQCVNTSIPPELAGKVHCATIAKERISTL